MSSYLKYLSGEYWLKDRPFESELYQNKLEAYSAHTLLSGERDPYYWTKRQFLDPDATGRKRFPFTKKMVKRAYTKTASSTARNAKRIKLLEQRVMKNTSEMKFVTGTILPAQLLGPNIDLTSAITQGNANGQRLADKIRVKRVEVFVQGVQEAERMRLTLFTPKNSGTGIGTNDNDGFHRFHDTNLFNIWDDWRNMDDLNDSDNPSGGRLTGKHPFLRKTFTFPMVVTYREGSAIPNSNGIELWHKKERFTGSGNTDPIGVDNDNVTINWKIWYYDG